MNKSATAEQSSIDKPLAQLDDYRLLGASGLRVSPLCLGAMTFGTEWVRLNRALCVQLLSLSHGLGGGRDDGGGWQQWGAGFEESKRMFDYYVEKGGNFIDTANIYTNGTSEQYVGELVAPLRSQMVVATKYSINAPPIPGLPVPMRLPSIILVPSPVLIVSLLPGFFNHGQERQPGRQSPQGPGAGSGRIAEAHEAGLRRRPLRPRVGSPYPH
jgi:hypothetical protein